MRDANVLITGASGFLGSHLTRRLVRAGARVHLVIRPTSSVERLAGMDPLPGCTRIDFNDSAGLDMCLRRVRPDVVFHLAASTSDRGRDSGRGEIAGGESVDAYDVNVMGTLRLLHATARVAPQARVIRSGSLSEYGVGPVPFHEDQREQPVSPYAASQVAATHLGQALFRQSGLSVTTVRLALTYGPGQSDRFLVPSLILACLEGRPFEMTAGTQTRDFVFVEDVIDALLSVAVASNVAGQVVNVGSGCEYGIGEMASLVVRLTGGRTALRVGRLPADQADLRRMVCDTQRARQLLGWQARTPIQEGLERTIEWCRARQSP